MGWQPTIEPRERILVIGGMGVGKSKAWLDAARKIPESRFYAIDSDRESIGRLLATDYQDVVANGNVTTYDVREWQDWVDAFKDAKATATRDDWLVTDMVGPAWDCAQDFYSQKVFGKDVEVYFLEARVAQKKGGAFDGRKDWGVIKGLYYANIQNQILDFPGHKFSTAGVKAIAEDADPAVKAIFGSHGVMPVAEKTIGHAMHTILLMKKKRQGQWTLSTIKDRGRKELEDAPLTDFFKEYLCSVAKWRPAAKVA